MKLNKTKADLWCATGNEFLHHIEAHCAAREKKLSQADHPAFRALSRALYTASQQFQERMRKEMERIAFEYSDT
jgi:biopolymer transport protein ExbB/TolQ